MRKTLALLAILLSSAAIAQTTLPPETVLGRLAIGPGPQQAIPFATLAQQLAPLISSGGMLNFVSDCGAVGDDATNNDAALSSCIARMVSTCHPMYIPSGTYRVTSAAVTAAPTCNFHIYGDGRFSKLKRMNSLLAPLITVTSGSPMVESIGFEYAGGPTAAGENQPLLYVGTTNGKIYNNYVSGDWYVGLELRSDTGGTMDSNFVIGVNNRALFLNTTITSNGRKSSVINNVVDGTNASSGTSYCINTTVGSSGSQAGIAIVNNQLSNCGSQGIALTAGPGAGGSSVISANVVANINGPGGTGILVQVDNGVQPGGIAVTGNSISGVSAQGISINGLLFGTVSGNSITAAPTGILLQNAPGTAITTDRTTITGNSLHNISGTGISNQCSNYVNIVGNQISAVNTGVDNVASSFTAVLGNHIQVAASGAIGVRNIDFTCNGVASHANRAVIRANMISVVGAPGGVIGVFADAGSQFINADLNVCAGCNIQATLLGGVYGGYALLTYAAGPINFNAAAGTDTAISITSPATNYRLSAMYVSACSAPITNAHFGLFQNTGGGGIAFVSDTVGLLTGTTAQSANSLQSINAGGGGTVMTDLTTVQFRLITPQGAPAACKVHVQIQSLP